MWGGAVVLGAVFCLYSFGQLEIGPQQHFDTGEELRKKADPPSLRQAGSEYERAAELWLSLHDAAHASAAFARLGQLAYSQRDYPSAGRSYQRAVELAREAGDEKAESAALHGSGRVFIALGDAPRAIEAGEQALAIQRRLGDRSGQGATLQNLGWAYFLIGENQKAFASYSEALEIRAAEKDDLGIGLASYGVASVRWAWGESEKAVDSYEKALAAYRAAKYDRGVADTLNSEGLAYADLGNHRKAVDLYTDALPLWRMMKDAPGEARTLNNLGLAYTALGQPRKAISVYERALALMPSSDARSRSYVLQNLGDAYAALKQSAKAVEYYEPSLEMKRQIGDRYGEAYTLARMAEAQLALGAPDKALSLFTKALDLDRAVGARAREAAVLAGMARAHAGLGKLEDARASMASSIDAIEALNAGLESRDLRTTFFETRQSYYLFYVDLLMRLGHARQALEVSERSRARTLIESIADARSEIRRGIDAASLERQLRLRNELHSRAQRLEATAGVSERKAFESAWREYNEFEASLRASSPKYAALTQPEPLTLADVQNRVLDRGVLLLEYALGAERSYAWLVSRSFVKSAVLPARAHIEEIVRRAQTALKARNESPQNESIEARRLRLLVADADFDRAARELGRILLGPFATALGTNRLLIVPDGALHYLPFAALPVGSPGRRLITTNQVVRLPSATTLSALREHSPERRVSRGIAVVADPVFDADDSRLTANAGRSARFVSAKMPAGAPEYARLRFSRSEAEDVAALASDRVRRFQDFDANRDLFTGDTLRNYGILHIASHTVVDNVHPLLSKIVLSGVDRTGHARDRYLRLFEIYNLSLNANLVVLSACRTAAGTEARGEGLVGLTRGFLYAGATDVVASLWSVQDRATGELMRRFYGGLLRRRLSPAAALQAAQIEMASDARWSSPYYWAAFTVLGEYR